MISDLRSAFRSLLKAPGFATIAIVTLALGFAVNITVFGVMTEFLLRTLQVRDPERLAFVMQRSAQISSMPFPLSYADFLDLRARVENNLPEDAAVRAVFAGLAAYATQPAHISDDGRRAERAWVHEVSDNYFSLLGVNAVLGRVFEAGEGIKPDADAIAILSHAYWVKRFAADPEIVGRKLLINGAPFTIIGVTPKGFGGAEAMTQAEVFVPATMAASLRPNQRQAIASRGYTSHIIIARLQPGADASQAQRAADTMLQSLIKAYPNEHAAATAVVVPEANSRPTPYVSHFTVPAITALMLLALLVLAVAGANITNLLYARASDAERALAIRSALGATRLRLIRLLVAESLLLAVAGAFVGWGASQWFEAMLQDFSLSADNPPPAAPAPSAWPIVFTVVAAAVTGVATGLLPALRATRMDVVTLIKDGAPGSGRTRHPFRTVLVAGQIALACIVLACAGLAFQSLRALARVELGYRTDNVLLATFDLDMQRYTRPQTEAFHRDLLHKVRSLPGVVSAGLGQSVPFDRHYALRGDIGAEGYVSSPQDQFLVNCVSVSPGFVESLRIRLVAGRAFSDRDDARAPAVAIVSQSVAARYWPGQDPIGRILTLQGGRKRVQVVGLMPDLRYFMLADAGRPQVFLPLAQEYSGRATLAVRTGGSPLAVASSLESIAHRLDSGLPIHNLTTFENHIATSPLGLMVMRFGTVIAATQGALVLLLSVMGIYGLVAFGVSRRTREIGIRMALGATVADVIRLVTRPTMILASSAIFVGLGFAALLSSLLRPVLYGRSPIGGVMIAVALLLIAATLLACWIPARRAARINPVDALRAE